MDVLWYNLGGLIILRKSTHRQIKHDNAIQHRAAFYITTLHHTIPVRAYYSTNTRHHRAPHNTTQCHTKPHSHTQCHTAPHSAIQRNSALHSAIQHRTYQHSTIRHHTAPHSAIQHYTAPFSPTQHHTAPHDTTQQQPAPIKGPLLLSVPWVNLRLRLLVRARGYRPRFVAREYVNF